MSGSQKALKVVSIILIVYAIIAAAFGVFMAVGASLLGGQTVDVNGTTIEAGLMASVLGGTIIVGAVINFIIGLLGLRGAKDAQKIGPFFVLCIIGVALSFVSLGMSLAQGTFSPFSLISLAIIIVCLVLASKVRNQR